MDHSARTFNLLCRELLQGLRATNGRFATERKTPPLGRPGKATGYPSPSPASFFHRFHAFWVKNKNSKKGCCKATPPGTPQAESRGGADKRVPLPQGPRVRGELGGEAGTPPQPRLAAWGCRRLQPAPARGQSGRGAFLQNGLTRNGGGGGWAAAAPVGGSEEARWDITPLASPLIRRKQVPRRVTH